MGSRRIYIAKKSGAVPRPIRVGEIWRRLISKHLLHRHETRMRQCMIEACQFGVSMPGGAEALVRTRETIEGTIRANPDLGILVVIDVDFHNAFSSLLHEAIESCATAVVQVGPKQLWGYLFHVGGQTASLVRC